MWGLVESVFRGSLPEYASFLESRQGSPCGMLRGDPCIGGSRVSIHNFPVGGRGCRSGHIAGGVHKLFLSAVASGTGDSGSAQGRIVGPAVRRPLTGS